MSDSECELATHKIYYASEKIWKKFYRLDGKLHGTYKMYYDGKDGNHGNLKMKIHFRKGKLHGSYKEYYIDGTTSISTNYVNGVEHGTYMQYYENGHLEMRCTYENGSEIGLYEEWDMDGTCVTKFENK